MTVTWRTWEFRLTIAGSLALLLACWCEQFDATPAAGGSERERQGFVCWSFTGANGRIHRYVLFIPYGLQPGAEPPVLHYLNGAGENGEEGIRQIIKTLWTPVGEMREFFPFLLVAPQCRTNGSWGADSADTEWALEILESVIDEFDADRD